MAGTASDLIEPVYSVLVIYADGSNALQAFFPFG